MLILRKTNSFSNISFVGYEQVNVYTGLQNNNNNDDNNNNMITVIEEK